MNIGVLILWLSTIPGAAPPVAKGAPAPTPEIKKLVEQLGEDKFVAREKASKKLEELGHKSILACITAQKHEDAEIRLRATQIVKRYFGIGVELASIWSLPDENRFPLGVEIEKDDEESEAMNNIIGGQGWCKEMRAKSDLGAYYFKKARKQYNAKLTDRDITNGLKAEEDEWLHDQVEQDAMRLYVYDMLFQGKKKEDLIKDLKKATELSSSHKNMLRHYGAGACKKKFIPGPLVPSEQVPYNAQYRFGYGG